MQRCRSAVNKRLVYISKKVLKQQQQQKLGSVILDAFLNNAFDKHAKKLNL